MRSGTGVDVSREFDPRRLVAPALVVAVASVSVSAIFVRFSSLHPVVLAFYRLLLSSVLLGPWAIYQYRDRRPALDRNALVLTVAAGGFLGLHYVLWFFSLHLTSVASATVLVTVHPLMILPLSYIFWRETTNVKALVSLAIALIGGVLITIGDWSLDGDHFLGDLIALAAAGAMGGYLMIGSFVRHRIPLVAYVATVYGVGAVLLCAATLMARLEIWPIPRAEWLIIAGLSVVPTLMGHNLFNWALRWTSPAIVSASVLGEPVGAALLAAWVFHEVPSWLQLLGGAAIIVGVALFSLTHKGRGDGRGAPTGGEDGRPS